MSAIYEAVFAVSLCATEKERKEHLVPIRVPLDNRLGQGKREIEGERERENVPNSSKHVTVIARRLLLRRGVARLRDRSAVERTSGYSG